MKQQKKNKDANSLPAVTKEAGATRFALNPFYEHLLEMKETKPASFKTMSLATRSALEAYTKAKGQAPAPEEAERKAAA